MAFYPRSIEIEGILYKQISPNQWQVVNTGQIIDNTRMVVIINEFKKKRVTPVTPGGGATGSCCEIPNLINGQFVCTNKDEGSCPGGCFKAGIPCGTPDIGPPECDGCVRCCYIADQYCVAKRPEQCVPVGNGGGTYFGSNGCTACKYGVCSSDQNNDTTNATERFYGSRGCTGTFIVGGGVSDFRTGVFCTGSGVGQTCFGPGMRYQDLTPVFIEGGTCTDCILGSCCTGGTCAGITSQSACANINGIFFAGQTCIQCNFGAFCTNADGAGTTCAGIGYRGQSLTQYFKSGSTCSSCIFGTCCTPQGDSFVTASPVSAASCNGTFFPGNHEANVCQKGSCCVGATCSENVFRYDCVGVFNAGMTCIACSNGACCLPGGGCTLTSMGACMATGGTFFGGATCSACDTGVCCNNGTCIPHQRRGNVCAGTFYAGADCNSAPCDLGACCTGGTCISNTEAINCSNLGGFFAGGFTCIGCATGANCTSVILENNDRQCRPNVYFGDVSDGTFYQNQGCSACESGACCNALGGGVTGIRGDCTGTSTFYAGKTLYICDAGVFCTGSNEGQTCFGLGHRGQSLTNNFIVGATCNSCILGACCTGGTCLGGGLTSQAACSSAGGLFFAGRTCTACDYGVYCTGATCLSLGYRGQSLSNNFIVGATCSSCILGACCTGGTCSGGGQTSQAACNGLFYAGATCRACDYGVYCTGATCFELGYRNQALTNNFIAGATCSSCILGACCTGGTCLGGGQTSQAACSIAGGTFYVGATCFQCDTGVFCTGSGVGQTCFGLGHRGQSLTNNFIAGGTCSSCILGACCTGGSCLGGGLTSQAACSAVGGLFYAGTTCVSCDYGVYCTGSNENTSCLGLGYRAQNLSNQFVIAGNCVSDCTYGSCCQGTTCLGITKQGNCVKPNSFFAGMTCAACDTGLGACCTGGSSSITTITGCQSIGGVFFPEGTTALCVTGSCCTGGTCTQQFLGLSSSCQLFIAGATCGICDTGVFCTGATCLQTGFRGQSLTSNFIVGATCNSCILGICCTGGTCIGGGQTAQINCPASVGTFVAGATQCSVCSNNVNCCINGTCSYVLPETCIQNNGIAFAGPIDPDCDVCSLGAFCTGGTCAGVTLYGYRLTPDFVKNGNCSNCITGVCCDEFLGSVILTQAECIGTFYPGQYDTSICVGSTYGICCTGGICTENTTKNLCDGYFVSNQDAAAYNLSCTGGMCETGICCKESDITSVTGGVCLGTLSRAECALTGGDFFPSSEGYTCSNCSYIPMLASAVFERFANNLGSGTQQLTNTFTGVETGFTGNEIQPVDTTKTTADTWISTSGNYNGSSATSTNLAIYRRALSTAGINGIVIQQVTRNFSPFKLWYNQGVTLHNPLTTSFGITYGVYDAPPDFSLGLKSVNGFSLGYILGVNNTQDYQVARYLRFVLGYGNSDDNWNGESFVLRWAGVTQTYPIYSLNDASLHAGLTLDDPRNVFPDTTPFVTTSGGTPSVSYSSPVLVQVFAENPLKYRVRPVGSCCKGITCLGILTRDHCTFTGGTFYENQRCDACDSALIRGNCCTGGTFYGFTSEDICNRINGYFKKARTEDRNVCIYGSECSSTEICIAPNIYFGGFSGSGGSTFVAFNYEDNLGCSACDRGICCVGLTCNGYIPRVKCSELGGDFYENESVCSDICSTGVCCNLNGGCGTYGPKINCNLETSAFLEGYTQGQTCSACEGLLRLTTNYSGVTFTFTLNKGTTYGQFWDGTYWVQETDNLRLVHASLQYRSLDSLFPNGQRGKTLYSYIANSIIEGLTLNSTGYKGSVFIHGLAKNPMPLAYYDKNGIKVGQNQQQFNSISYASYAQGWSKGNTPSATENPSNYPDFGLTKFLNTRSKLYGGGLTLQQADVVLFSCSNFDIYPGQASNYPKNSGGYPYQIQRERANTLAYGILNCLSATGAALAGSTTCFRPPNTWPEEDRLNKPLYPISLILNKVPGTSGNTLIDVEGSAGLSYSSSAMGSPLQVSEFGDAVAYPVITPMWAVEGEGIANRTYGEVFVIPIQTMLESVHATGNSGTRLTQQQRNTGIIKVTQYGLDSWGAQKTYTLNLTSGAGQKAARTRSWIPIAGYFLGVSAMYDPESTMIQDTVRRNALVADYYKTDKFVDTPGKTCTTHAGWYTFRFGGTYPDNNYFGLRRHLGRLMSSEANSMVEVSNDPTNLVRYADYLGSYYKNTGISGFTTGGATGITFYNDYNRAVILGSNRVGITGDFGVIRWGSITREGWSFGSGIYPPFGKRFNYSTKEGYSWTNMKLQVVSGPGSNGGAGSRLYRIIWGTCMWVYLDDGEIVDACEPERASAGGGWQFVLGQTWADGVPDHTSVIKLYPFTTFDSGLTRPSITNVNGVTGSVFFIIENKFDGDVSLCPITQAKNDALLWDANPSPETPYFSNNLDAYATQYLFADYITRTKGITLSSDAIPLGDYIRQYVYTSPYNIVSLFPWYSSSNKLFDTWLGTSWTSKELGASRIDFDRDYPGVKIWGGITV